MHHYVNLWLKFNFATLRSIRKTLNIVIAKVFVNLISSTEITLTSGRA